MATLGGPGWNQYMSSGVIIRLFPSVFSFRVLQVALQALDLCLKLT